MFLSSCLGVCLCFCCWFCIFIYLSGENIKVRAKGHRQRAAVVGVLVAQWCNVSISSTLSTKTKKRSAQIKRKSQVQSTCRDKRCSPTGHVVCLIFYFSMTKCFSFIFVHRSTDGSPVCVIYFAWSLVFFDKWSTLLSSCS